MKENARKEVVDLHAFFVDWFQGRLPPTKAAFARFANVMGAEFYIVSPHGRLMERTALLNGLWQAHGQWAANGGTIEIRNFVLRGGSEQLWATYEEWQTVQGEERGRLSTVLFAKDNSAPYGLVWLLAHETWLPEK
jgi:hypothetical protein